MVCCARVSSRSISVLDGAVRPFLRFFLRSFSIFTNLRKNFCAWERTCEVVRDSTLLQISFQFFPWAIRADQEDFLPEMKRSCQSWVQRPSSCGSSLSLEGDSSCMQKYLQSYKCHWGSSKLSMHYNYITRMRMNTGLIVLLLCAVTLAEIPHLNKKQIADKIDSTKINYGSTIRIKAAAFPYYLHSHNVNYPRGSGQQSVTGFPMDDDYNSLWTIKESHRENVKTYYHELRCGDTIRLEHALTKRNLHSEEIFQSLITNGQQVSAFGEGGDGDDNDNWILQCKGKANGQPFYGGDMFELIHENTEKRLKMSRYYEYKFDNWENCPFQGQIEVSGTDRPTRETEFKIVGGVFFKDKAGSQDNRNEDL